MKVSIHSIAYKKARHFNALENIGDKCLYEGKHDDLLTFRRFVYDYSILFSKIFCSASEATIAPFVEHVLRCHNNPKRMVKAKVKVKV